MNIFKQEENKPFSYSSIEERKSSRSHIWWIVGAILVLCVAIILYIN